MEKKNWSEFRKSGLLWFVNSILHIFGWAIVFAFSEKTKVSDDSEPIAVYPARVKYRGFSEQCNTEGYLKVTEYLEQNISDLLEEARDE